MSLITNLLLYAHSKIECSNETTFSIYVFGSSYKTLSVILQDRNREQTEDSYKNLGRIILFFYSVDRGPHKDTACENAEKARLFTLKKLLHISGCKLKLYCVLLDFYPQFATIVSINPKKHVNQNENQNNSTVQLQLRPLVGFMQLQIKKCH